MTVFCAHPRTAAFLLKDFDPVSDLAITMPSVDGTGSMISLGGHDGIPRLDGTISPIYDRHGRLYMYTKNISVDGQQRQPFSFAIGRAIQLCDAQGRVFALTFRDVVGSCFLLEYAGGSSVEG